MNPALQMSLDIAVRSSTRSQWFRDTLKAIIDQEDHERTAVGAFELIRAAKHRQAIAIAKSWQSEDYEPKLRTTRPRLRELTEMALNQYLGLPVPEADLDYNRFLKCYSDAGDYNKGWSNRREYTDFEQSGVIPQIMRTKDLENPPALWEKFFTAPEYVEPTEKSLDAEIARIESSPVSAPWLSEAMRTIPNDSRDVYQRGVLTEVKELLRWAAAIHRDTPAELGGQTMLVEEINTARGASGDPEVRNVFREIPNEKQRLPRDGYGIGVTEDAPFLAFLLARGVKEIHEAHDLRGDLYWFHDLVEAQRFVEENWLNDPVSYTRSGIYIRFRTLFWSLRRLLSLELQYPCSIKSKDLILRSADDSAPSEQLLRFAAALKHPFVPGDDPILNSPDKIRFYHWKPTEPGVTFCPIDGPVTAPLIFDHSGKPTIDEVTVCPDCLGTLYWKELCHFSY